MGCSYLKSRRDHSLACHNRRENSNDQTRVEHAWWHGVEERIGVGARVLANVCSLADVLYRT